MSDYLGSLATQSLNHPRNLPAADGVLRPRLASRFEPSAAKDGPLPETWPPSDEAIGVTESAGDDRSSSDGQAPPITGRRLPLADRESSIGSHAPSLIDHDPLISEQHAQSIQTAPPAAFQDVRQSGSVLAAVDAQSDRLMSTAHSIESTQLPGVSNAVPSASQPDIGQSDPLRMDALPAVMVTQSDFQSYDDPSVPIPVRAVPARVIARPVEKLGAGPAVEPDTVDRTSDNMHPNFQPQDNPAVPVIVPAMPAPVIALPVERPGAEPAIEPHTLVRAPDNMDPNFQPQDNPAVPVIVRTVPVPVVARPVERPVAESAIELRTLERVLDPIRAVTQANDNQVSPPAVHTQQTTIAVQPAKHIVPSSIKRVPDPLRSLTSRVDPTVFGFRARPVAAKPLRNTMAEPEKQADQPAPIIHVTIGRIEVRAAPAPPAPASKPRSTAVMNLDEYLRRRATGGS